MNLPLKYEGKREKINIFDSILIFLACGFIGWLIEVCYVFVTTGEIANRGISSAPICTIYGLGALILYVIFGIPARKKINVLYVFVISSFILGIYELASGLVLKYILCIEMWNYSMDSLNILGYTTIQTSLGWGILATFYLFLVQAKLMQIIRCIPENIKVVLALILISLYFIDVTRSFCEVRTNPKVMDKW